MLNEGNYKSVPLESAGDKKEPFSLQIERLLEATRSNLNYIDNRLLEINRNLLPPSAMTKVEESLGKQQEPQGWFQKVISELKYLGSKSGDIKMELDLLFYEVTNKK